MNLNEPGVIESPRPVPGDGSPARERESVNGDLRQVIDQAARLLPAQGPITSFVFLNSLQALEDLPFETGLRKGAKLFGCQPFLTENAYRERINSGRIRLEDLFEVVGEDLGDTADDPVVFSTTRFVLRLAMLQYPLRSGRESELRWFAAETRALKSLRKDIPKEVSIRLVEETRQWVKRELQDAARTDHDRHPARNGGSRMMLADLIEQHGEASIESWSDSTWESITALALWRVCREGTHGIDSPAPIDDGCIRHRDLLRIATGEDSDLRVHEVLIRFCAAYSDQGLAAWALPGRHLGFFSSFAALHGIPSTSTDRWLHRLPRELARIASSGMEPIDSIRESLELLGVGRDEWSDYISSTLLALRGWAGMIRQMEVRADRVSVGAPAGTLVEFIAVRLILERISLEAMVREALSYRGPLSRLREYLATRRPGSRGFEQRAFHVFQIAQILGWGPAMLRQLSKVEWRALLAEIESFSAWERRRLFQRAFERQFRMQALDAVSQHVLPAKRLAQRPRFQAVFCIDAREESFRRHLEENSPDVETFGAAGFFGVAMYYRGISDAQFTALCPIVIRPKHWVVEDVVYPFARTYQFRTNVRKAFGTATHRIHLDTRSLTRGTLLTAGLGVLASVPLVMRVLFPRLTARFRRTLTRWVGPPAVTRLQIERTTLDPGQAEDQIGFSVDEMADIGERMLRDIGLTENFSRLVLFLGHGSVCLNNPHKSAYDCGACSGGAGGPNARVLAAMLNDTRVRAILANRGLAIPRETVFLGGLHNTCDDTISFFDLDLLPRSHFHDFDAASKTLGEICQRNAHERCRRFESASLNLSVEEAHRHVKERSEDLAQARPEFGNATNAMCIVGRRERFRGLFLDRRSFLHSYDPTCDDDEHSILTRILGAVVPVCSGINLQYFFSSIDPFGWGSGTKLPHNITSLLGVMDGAASDLRSGLPLQGVEIHEPMRLLFVIETTPAGIEQVMERNPAVRQILKNGWAQLALLAPDSSELLVYRDGQFTPHMVGEEELSVTTSSFDWYRGWRGNLQFATIDNRDVIGPDDAEAEIDTEPSRRPSMREVIVTA